MSAEENLARINRLIREAKITSDGERSRIFKEIEELSGGPRTKATAVPIVGGPMTPAEVTALEDALDSGASWPKAACLDIQRVLIKTIRDRERSLVAERHGHSPCVTHAPCSCHEDER